MALRLGVDPGVFLAELPAHVHFPPDRAVVLYLMRSRPAPSGGREIFGTTSLVMHASALTTDLPRGVLGAGPDFALAIIVDDRLASAASAGDRPRSAMQAFVDNDLTPALSEQGITMTALWATPSLHPGSPWWDIAHPDRHGLIGDPATTPTGLTETVYGLGIHSSRGAFAAELDINPACADPVMAVLEQHDHYDNPPEPADEDDDADRAAAQLLLSTLATGERPAAPMLAQLAVALARDRVAAVMLGTAATEHGAAAEQLWLTMTRSLRGRHRSRPAALLALSAYRRGDGVLARAAYDIAATTAPADPLARLLNATLDYAIPPDSTNHMTTSVALKHAAALGVDLGPLTTPEHAHPAAPPTGETPPAHRTDPAKQRLDSGPTS